MDDIDEMARKLWLHSKVRKRRGYKWPGIIVSCFLTTKGDLRFVVECTVPEVEGALHIFSPEQLELDDD